MDDCVRISVLTCWPSTRLRAPAIRPSSSTSPPPTPAYLSWWWESATASYTTRYLSLGWPLSTHFQFLITDPKLCLKDFFAPICLHKLYIKSKFIKIAIIGITLKCLTTLSIYMWPKQVSSLGAVSIAVTRLGSARQSLQMRISQISLEDNGVVASNLQKRTRNFSKMLTFIFVRWGLLCYVPDRVVHSQSEIRSEELLTPALLWHKEPAEGMQNVGSLWH